MSRTRRRTRAGLALALALLAACATPAPLAPELRAALERAPAPAPALRRTATVTLEGRAAGRYTAALIARTGADAAFRLQLLPQVGGKVLDLAFDGQRLAGHFPGAGVRLEHHLEQGAPPRHLLAFLAMSVAEELVPLAGRVQGRLRSGTHGTWLAVRPALGHGRVEVCVDPEGAVLARSFHLRHVGWTERHEAGARVFEGRGFAWRLEDEREEAVGLPPDALFQLELPPEERP